VAPAVGEEELTMKQASRVLTLLAVAAYGAAVTAQVYVTKDADGNTVYTDMPPVVSDPIELPPTNIGDSVKVEPEQESEPAEPSAAPPAPEPGTPEYDEKIEREMEAYRKLKLERYRAGQTEQRNEVR
jgi:hypothetical protein